MLDDPRDARMLAKLAAQVLDDGRVWSRVAAQARHTARPYTWDRTAAETLRVYEEVVEEAERRQGGA